jgi:hypothetical protein
LFNVSVYIQRYTGPESGNQVNSVYKEVKQKTYEKFGPFNASIQYQPTLQELNEMGLLQPANAMITFVVQDIQSGIGSLGTVGYNAVSTQDLVLIPWVDGTTKLMRLAEYTYQTQFAGSWIFLNSGCVDVLT